MEAQHHTVGKTHFLLLFCGVEYFPYPYKNLSPDSGWNLRLRSAAALLFSKLSTLDPDKLSISDYQKNYLGNYLQRLHYGMETGIFILSHVFDGLNQKPEHAVLLDHGGGTGILSMLAKAAGVGKVVYEDIYDVSCHDARSIALSLGLEADEYLHGDEKAIVRYFKQQGGPDVIISRNVIEHVYQPESLVQTLSEIHNKSMQILFATTGNYDNPAVRAYTRKLQRKAEYTGLRSRWDKGTDAKKPLFEIRREMISDLAPEFDAETIGQMAKHTRGLIKPAILMALEDFKSSGRLPPVLSDPHNTCDPETGNWVERLSSIAEYHDIFEENGFHFRCLPGFYDTHYRSAAANLLATFLNPCIRLLGSKGTKLSPFIGLKGTRILTGSE